MAPAPRTAFVDAHHGDGVQAAFYDTDRVLTISLHETGETLFPGTGSVEELGRGPGEGFAVNVPLTQAVGRLRDLCPAWIALGGGGYHPETVARGWSLAWAIMNHQELPGGIVDSTGPAGDSPERLRAWRYAREQVRRLQDLVFARHGLAPAA